MKRKGSWPRSAFAFLVVAAALNSGRLASAQSVEGSFLPAAASSFPDSPGMLGQAGSDVISWDGSNGISINSLVGADTFYGAGVFGQGTVTANVEAGLIWNGHETTSTLNDFYVSPGASGEVSRHATWVGSILAGYNPNQDPNNYPYYQLGITPSTQLSSGAIATQWNDDGSFDITPKTFYSAYNYYFTQTWTHSINTSFGSVSFSGPTDVINSSWGYTDAAGTDPYTMAADGLARANPLTALVVAAGNSTTDSDPSDNVDGPASGYNSIAVGAVGNFTYNQYNTVATFSSRGPQDYYDPVHGLVQGVRASVDLVAPGTSLLSAFYGGQTGENGAQLSTTQPDTTGGAGDYYSYGLAGTSFAAPIVAGGVSLLKSAGYIAGLDSQAFDTRIIKAVLMNSATKLPGWNNGQYVNGSGVTVTTQALDWAQGAGMLNLNSAFDQYLSGTQDVPGLGGGSVLSTGWDFGSLTMSAYNDYTMSTNLQAGNTMNVTLDWFRDLENPVFTDNADPDLQSLTTADDGFANLDLEIWNASFTQLYAESMSQYNDAQELDFTLPEDGLYGIRVAYDSQMFGTPQPEDYGLAWSVVPEAGTWAPLLVGLGAMCGLRRRMRRG